MSQKNQKNQNSQKRGRGRPRKYPKIEPQPLIVEPPPAVPDNTLALPTAKEIAAEIVDGLIDALRRELPIVARIAAADLRHSSEPAEKVFDRAIKEGRLAAAVWSAQNEVRR